MAARFTDLAAEFATKWLNEPGNEKQQTSSFRTELLHDVLGVERPTDAIVFEYPVKCDGATRYVDAYLPGPRVLLNKRSRTLTLRRLRYSLTALSSLPTDRQNAMRTTCPSTVVRVGYLPATFAKSASTI